MPEHVISVDFLRDRWPDIFHYCEYADVGLGWLPLIEDMCATLVTVPVGSALVVELKEKYGALRVWLLHEGLTPEQEVDVVLAKYLAEERSRFICEECGQPGRIRKPPTLSFAWLRCRCDAHATVEELTWQIDRKQPRRQLRGILYVYDTALNRMRVAEDWKPGAGGDDHDA